METETSLPNAPSNSGAPATELVTAPATAPAAAPAAAPATAPAAAPAAAPSVEQPLTSQAAAEQPATSDQLAAAPQVEAAAPTHQAPAAADPAQQQQADNAAAPADPTATAMQDGSSRFTPGTVLQFDMDADDVTDSTTLDFRAIRPVFGGKEGGVRHCDYQRVSDNLDPMCQHDMVSHYQRNAEKRCTCVHPCMCCKTEAVPVNIAFQLATF